MARTLRGWALVAMGQVDEGLAEADAGYTAFRKSGAGLRRSYYLMFLGDAYRMIGQPENGLLALREALALRSGHPFLCRQAGRRVRNRGGWRGSITVRSWP